jgi:hypothetical protein
MFKNWNAKIILQLWDLQIKQFSEIHLNDNSLADDLNGQMVLLEPTFQFQFPRFEIFMTHLKQKIDRSAKQNKLNVHWFCIIEKNLAKANTESCYDH